MAELQDRKDEVRGEAGGGAGALNWAQRRREGTRTVGCTRGIPGESGEIKWGVDGEAARAIRANGSPSGTEWTENPRASAAKVKPEKAEREGESYGALPGKQKKIELRMSEETRWEIRSAGSEMKWKLEKYSSSKFEEVFHNEKQMLHWNLIHNQLYVTYGPDRDHYLELLRISSLTDVRRDIEEISKEMGIPVLTVLTVQPLKGGCLIWNSPGSLVADARGSANKTRISTLRPRIQ
jgi:hypothetical protein